MTSNGGRLYLSQYDDLVAGRFGVQPPSSIWRSTIVDEDFTGMGYAPNSHLGYYYPEFKQECIKGKRINDLMDWLDDIVVYHRLFDSNYTPSGIDVTSTGFTWKINDGLGLVDYTPVAPSSYTGQLDGYPWNDDYIWKQLRGAITLVCQNVNIVPPHDMGEFNDGEKDWFKYLQTIDVKSKNDFVSYLSQYYKNVLVTEDVLNGFQGIPDGTIRYTIEGSGVICPSRWLLTGISPEGYKQESIIGFQNTNYSGGYVSYSETYAIDKNPITESSQGTGDGIWLPQTNNKNQPIPLNKKISELNEGKQPYYELGQYGKPFKTEYLQYFPDTSGVEKGTDVIAGNTTVHIKPHDEMVFTSFVLSKSGGASASGDLRNYDDVDQYGNYSNLYDYISWYRRATPLNNAASGTYTYDIKSIYNHTTTPWTYGIIYYGKPTYDFDKPIQNEYWTDFNAPTKRQRDDMSKFVEPDGWMFNGSGITYSTGYGGSFSTDFVVNYVLEIPKYGPATFLGGQSDKQLYYQSAIDSITRNAAFSVYTSFTTFAFSAPLTNVTTPNLSWYYNSNLEKLKPIGCTLDVASSTINEYDDFLDASNSIYNYLGYMVPEDSTGNIHYYNTNSVSVYDYAGGLNNLTNLTGFIIFDSLYSQTSVVSYLNQSAWKDGDAGNPVYIPVSITLNHLSDTNRYNRRDYDWDSLLSNLTEWGKVNMPVLPVYNLSSQAIQTGNQSYSNNALSLYWNWDHNGNFVQQPVYNREKAVFQANVYNNQFYTNAYGSIVSDLVSRMKSIVEDKTTVTTKYEGHITNIYPTYGHPDYYYTNTPTTAHIIESQGCIWGTSGNVVISQSNKVNINSDDAGYAALVAGVAAGIISPTNATYLDIAAGTYKTISADWEDANADLYYNWPTERSDWALTFPPNLANNMRESLQKEYDKNDTANRWGLSINSNYSIGAKYIGNFYQYYNSVDYNYLYPRMIYDVNTGGYIQQPDTVVNGKSTFYYNDIFASGKYEQKMYGCYTYLGQSSLRNKLGVQFADNQAKVKVNTIFGVANTLLDGEQGASNEYPASTYNHRHFYQYHKDEHWDSSATYKFSYGFIESVDASGIINGIRNGKFTPICQSTGGMQWMDLSNGEIHRTLEEIEVDLTPIIDMKPPASTSGNYYLVFLHYVDPIDLVFKEPKVWWEQPLVDEETFNYYGQRYGFTVAPHVDSLKTVTQTQNVVNVSRLGPTVEHTETNNTIDINYTAGNYTVNNQLYLKNSIGVSNHDYVDYLTYYLLPSNGHYEYKLNTTDHFTQYYSPSTYTTLGGYLYTGRFSDYNNYGITYDGTPHGVWNSNQTSTVALPILPPPLMLKIDKPLYVI